jgi:hypothetical protein
VREIDFLPAWYPQLRRQRSLFRAQVWLSFAILCAIVITLVSMRTSVVRAQSELRTVEDHLTRTFNEVKELDETISLQKQLMAKQQLAAQLGLPVELTRVMAEVASCMPAEMSLEEVGFTTEEYRPSIAEAARNGTAASLISRKMRVRLKGVAPSETHVGGFFGKLSDRRFLDEVRRDSTYDRDVGVHRVRAFEISFTIPLDYQIGK